MGKDIQNNDKDKSQKPVASAKQPQKSSKQIARDDKALWNNMTEEQIDKILKDSFPASDPPSWH